MDLTSFTSKKKEEKELIVDNDDICIYKTDKEYEFTIKTVKGLEHYQNHLFFAPTHSLETVKDTSKAINQTQEFFEQALSEKVEGIMVKGEDAPYVSGLRTGNMAKLKETKEDLDVVILAAEHGTGKRAGFYSSFYVGIYNPDAADSSEEFLMVGKVSSGIKELGEEGASMKNLTELLKPFVINEEKNITYFEPKIIIQVRYQEIQPSTTYNSGYALRFPRIIMLREDKPVEEINTIDDLKSFI